MERNWRKEYAQKSCLASPVGGRREDREAERAAVSSVPFLLLKDENTRDDFQTAFWRSNLGPEVSPSTHPQFRDLFIGDLC